MAEETISPRPEASKKRSARSVFPRLSLKKVLVLPEKINELGEGEPVPRLVVFDRLGKSPDSSSSRMLVTASNAYGLTTGGYQAERLGITEVGKKLAISSGALHQAAGIRVLFGNDLFAQFYERFKNKVLPDEAIAHDFLKQSGGLSDADAKAAADVFFTNLKDYGFVRELSGRLTVVSQDILDTVTVDEPNDALPTPTADFVPGAVATPVVQAQNSLPTPQFNFNIQVELPENATPETYDAIFKSMSEHLLKRTSL